VRIIAPFPAGDYREVPTMLTAETFANTLAPHGRLNGMAFKVAIGTEHVKTAGFPPLQFAESPK
jgi:hypothetical protein